MVGQSVSHYRILGHLGQGAMGVVYRALDTRLNRPVALKFIPRHLSGDETALKRFELEARAASSLDHQNICTIYEVDETVDGRTFIAMACYEGQTLAERIRERPLSSAEVIRLGSQIADGLAEAHRKGIVHRDLKPDNVVLTSDGVVKIVDFGLARLLEEARITRTHATAGTPAYMAPEQIVGDEVDHRADIWALGIVLHEMATGCCPFEADYADAMMYRILHHAPDVSNELDPRLASVVRRCLEKDADDRFASATDLKVALESRFEAPVRRPRHVARWTGAAVFVVIVFLIGLLKPPVHGLTIWPGQSSNAEINLAVLPLRVIGAATQADVYARGLSELISSKLTQLEQYSETPYWVVPTSEILNQEVSSAGDARKAFGVELVVDGSVQQSDGLVRLILNLVDARTARMIDTWEGRFSDEVSLSVQDEATLQVARMLSLKLEPEIRDALSAGGSSSLVANELYIQGIGHLQQYHDARNVEAAVDLLDRALDEDPEFTSARAGLAEAYWRLYEATRDPGHAELALVNGRRVELHRDLPAQVYAAIGLVYSGTGRHEEALETFQKALDRNPSNVDAHRGRANALAALGRSEEAEAAFLEAISKKPDFWASYHDLGLFYYNIGDLEKAAAQFEHEVALTPDNHRALSTLGGVYFYMGRVSAAEIAFRRSLVIESTSRAHSNLGTLYFHTKRYDEAIAAFQEALRLQDRDYRIYRNLGTAYYALEGQTDNTNGAFAKAYELAESQLEFSAAPQVLDGECAVFLIHLGREDEARVRIGRLLRDPTDDPYVHLSLATAYALLDDLEASAEWATKALQNGLPAYEIEIDPRLAPITQLIDLEAQSA